MNHEPSQAGLGWAGSRWPTRISNLNRAGPRPAEKTGGIKVALRAPAARHGRGPPSAAGRTGFSDMDRGRGFQPGPARPRVPRRERWRPGPDRLAGRRRWTRNLGRTRQPSAADPRLRRRRCAVLSGCCDGEVIGCFNMLTRKYTTGRRQHYSRENRERLVTNNFVIKQRNRTPHIQHNTQDAM